MVDNVKASFYYISFNKVSSVVPSGSSAVFDLVHFSNYGDLGDIYEGYNFLVIYESVFYYFVIDSVDGDSSFTASEISNKQVFSYEAGDNVPNLFLFIPLTKIFKNFSSYIEEDSFLFIFNSVTNLSEKEKDKVEFFINNSFFKEFATAPFFKELDLHYYSDKVGFLVSDIDFDLVYLLNKELFLVQGEFIFSTYISNYSILDDYVILDLFQPLTTIFLEFPIKATVRSSSDIFGVFDIVFKDSEKITFFGEAKFPVVTETKHQKLIFNSPFSFFQKVNYFDTSKIIQSEEVGEINKASLFGGITMYSLLVLKDELLNFKFSLTTSRKGVSIIQKSNIPTFEALVFDVSYSGFSFINSLVSKVLESTGVVKTTTGGGSSFTTDINGSNLETNAVYLLFGNEEGELRLESSLGEVYLNSFTVIEISGIKYFVKIPDNTAVADNVCLYSYKVFHYIEFSFSNIPESLTFNLSTFSYEEGEPVEVPLTYSILSKTSTTITVQVLYDDNVPLLQNYVAGGVFENISMYKLCVNFLNHESVNLINVSPFSLIRTDIGIFAFTVDYNKMKYETLDNTEYVQVSSEATTPLTSVEVDHFLDSKTPYLLDISFDGSLQDQTDFFDVAQGVLLPRSDMEDTILLPKHKNAYLCFKGDSIYKLEGDQVTLLHTVPGRKYFTHSVDENFNGPESERFVGLVFTFVYGGYPTVNAFYYKFFTESEVLQEILHWTAEFELPDSLRFVSLDKSPDIATIETRFFRNDCDFVPPTYKIEPKGDLIDDHEDTDKYYKAYTVREALAPYLNYMFSGMGRQIYASRSGHVFTLKLNPVISIIPIYNVGSSSEWKAYDAYFLETSKVQARVGYSEEEVDQGAFQDLNFKYYGSGFSATAMGNFQFPDYADKVPTGREKYKSINLLGSQEYPEKGRPFAFTTKDVSYSEPYTTTYRFLQVLKKFSFSTPSYFCIFERSPYISESGVVGKFIVFKEMPYSFLPFLFRLRVPELDFFPTLFNYIDQNLYDFDNQNQYFRMGIQAGAFDVEYIGEFSIFMFDGSKEYFFNIFPSSLFYLDETDSWKSVGSVPFSVVVPEGRDYIPLNDPKLEFPYLIDYWAPADWNNPLSGSYQKLESNITFSQGPVVLIRTYQPITGIYVDCQSIYSPTFRFHEYIPEEKEIPLNVNIFWSSDLYEQGHGGITRNRATFSSHVSGTVYKLLSDLRPSGGMASGTQREHYYYFSFSTHNDWNSEVRVLGITGFVKFSGMDINQPEFKFNISDPKTDIFSVNPDASFLVRRLKRLRHTELFKVFYFYTNEVPFYLNFAYDHVMNSCVIYFSKFYERYFSPEYEDVLFQRDSKFVYIETVELVENVSVEFFVVLRPRNLEKPVELVKIFIDLENRVLTKKEFSAPIEQGYVYFKSFRFDRDTNNWYLLLRNLDDQYKEFTNASTVTGGSNVVSLYSFLSSFSKTIFEYVDGFNYIFYFDYKESKMILKHFEDFLESSDLFHFADFNLMAINNIKITSNPVFKVKYSFLEDDIYIDSSLFSDVGSSKVINFSLEELSIPKQVLYYFKKFNMLLTRRDFIEFEIETHINVSIGTLLKFKVSQADIDENLIFFISRKVYQKGLFKYKVFNL